jgi:GTP cyclohydrolase II
MTRSMARPSVRTLAQAKLPTSHGVFDAVCFAANDEVEHLALSVSMIAPAELPPQEGATAGEPPLVRIHSECLTGEALGSRRCDCGPQLDTALQTIADHGHGMVLYLRGHEGRGIGLAQKIRAYALQEQGLDTVEANLALGEPVDRREYSAATSYLRQLGIEEIRLLTNNPEKVAAVEAAGIRCVEVVPMPAHQWPANKNYLATKAERLGHHGLLQPGQAE